MFRFTDNIIGQMTLQCNLNCRYCYEGSEVKKHKRMMTVDQFKETLDYAIYERCILGTLENSLSWHFHGGEPLLFNWNDFKECVRYIHERQSFFSNLTCCIQTNGTLLDDEKAKFFVKENATVGLSFDGFSCTDRMSEEENISLIKNVKRLHDAYGLKIGILSTISKKNVKTWYNDMLKISDFIENFGTNVIVPPIGQDDLVPTPDDLWKYIIEPCLNSLLTDKPLKERLIGISFYKFIESNLIRFNHKTSMKKTGCFDRVCGHGINMISVTPETKIHDCDKHLEEGDFIKDRLEIDKECQDFLGLQQIKRYAHFCDSIFKLENKYGCNDCYASDFCLGGCQSYNLTRFEEFRLDTSICSVYKKMYDFFKENYIEILKHYPVWTGDDILEIFPEFQRALEKNNCKMIINDNYLYVEENK